MFYNFITIYTDIFVVKMRVAFAMQKLLTFFDKNIGVFQGPVVQSIVSLTSVLRLYNQIQ